MPRLVLVVLLVMGVIGAASASPIIIVTPSLAPNAFGSPSWSQYVANANYAQLNGLSSYGDPASPSYYKATSNILASDAIVTGFPSWLGVADPGTVYGSAYASELGNRMHFGLFIQGNGSQISIDGISFTGTSDDPGDLLGWSWARGSYNYSNDYMGIIYGSGGSMTFITSGPNSQKVDAIVGRGSGNSLDAYCPGCSVEQQQAAIAASLVYANTIQHLTGVYTYSEGDGVIATGSGTFNIEPTPEPGTWVLLAGGMIGLAGLRRKR